MAVHASQKDYATGFGGKYGVQKDRIDKVNSAAKCNLRALSVEIKDRLMRASVAVCRGVGPRRKSGEACLPERYGGLLKKITYRIRNE